MNNLKLNEFYYDSIDKTTSENYLIKGLKFKIAPESYES